jgi:sialate O-acetylesterase
MLINLVRMNRSFVGCAASLAILLALPAARANVALPDVISNGMVLQRDQAVPIWGTAEPGETVVVKFASQTQTTQAGVDGKWRLTLQPMSASTTPSSMIISGKNTITLDDVLVGEVWMVAGQSNMQFTVAESADGQAAIAAASDPAIRLFNISRKVAFQHESGPLALWQPASPASVRDFSAAGYYFAVQLRNELRVSVGVINSSYGGTQAEAWTPVEYLLASPELRPCVERTKIWDEERPRVQAEYERQMQQWREVAEKARAEGTHAPSQPRVPDALRESRIAASIYDRMIAPLIPFAIRGVVWYQGESNEARAQQYELLLPTLIKAWRERWGEGNFPFGIVQLPNYRDSRPDPSDEPWSFLREAQRRTALTTPNSGLIVTIDIGEVRDIHPKNKLDVGKRMARWALVGAYGRKMTPSGPMFRDATPKGSRLVLTFDDVGKGLRVREGDELQEFAVAGADHRWHWASAKIKGRKQVIVWSDSVLRPQAVRYAFNSNPQHPNLTNDTGIPAAPFRSDNWPGPTDGKR